MKKTDYSCPLQYQYLLYYSNMKHTNIMLLLIKIVFTH